jgi:FXSXX-COOH protein
MTTQSEAPIRTGIVKSAGLLPLDELLALRESGDSALDHCLRRVVETAATGAGERVAAFNASPPLRR